MALPPTVPTSFVPKQPVQTTRRAGRGSGQNLFMTVSLIVMGLAIAGSGATLGYQKYLEAHRDKKAEQLAAAEASITRMTIEDFLRLQNRLSATETLLDYHVALSQFFDRLEELTLTSVSFDKLELSVDKNLVTIIAMDGTARSFNALAAQSASFASEKRIKRAIFSDIKTSEGGFITFSLTAELDPELITWKGPEAAAAPVVTPPAQP